MNNTALGAENKKKQTISFISEAHEKFYYEKLKEVRYQDVYHKALCYCLGISDDTRRNVDSIYDFIEEFETEDKTRLTMFPFGLDPFGNFYCIKENKVVFFDHESNTVLPIASTFTEFLGMLYA